MSTPILTAYPVRAFKVSRSHAYWTVHVQRESNIDQTMVMLAYTWNRHLVVRHPAYQVFAISTSGDEAIPIYQVFAIST